MFDSSSSGLLFHALMPINTAMPCPKESQNKIGTPTPKPPPPHPPPPWGFPLHQPPPPSTPHPDEPMFPAVPLSQDQAQHYNIDEPTQPMTPDSLPQNVSTWSRWACDDAHPGTHVGEPINTAWQVPGPVIVSNGDLPSFHETRSCWENLVSFIACSIRCFDTFFISSFKCIW